FIWSGVAMTVRRLRSAGLPLWLVTLFFLPIVNLATIGVLCLLSERTAERQTPDWKASGASAILIAVAVSVAAVMLGVGVFRGYGVGLFIALPFCLGFLSVLIFNS